MATYDNNLDLDRDKIRLLVGDTDDDHQMLADNEIAFFLAQNGDDLYMTAAMCCEAIASKFARDVDYRFSTMWQNASEAYDHYKDRAETYRALQATQSAVIPAFQSGPGMDEEYPEIFWYGMNDNPPVLKTDE